MAAPTSTPAGMPTGAPSLEGAKRRAPANALFNAAGLVINLVLTTFITARLVHGLGDVAFGIWSLVGHIAGNMNMLDFGMVTTVTRYAAHHHARDERRNVAEVFSTALLFSLVPAALALLAGGVIAWLAPTIFNLPIGYVTSGRVAILLTAMAVAVAFPGGVLNSGVPALSRYDLLNLRNIAWSVVRVGMLLWVLDHGHGLIAVAAASLLAQCLAFGFGAYLSSRLLPWVRLSWRHVRRSMFQDLYRFSFWVFLMAIGNRLILSCDNVVVSIVRGPAAVAIYGIGGSIADQLRGGMYTVGMLYAPLASQTHAVNGRAAMPALLLRATRIATLLVLPGVASLVALGSPFLGFWLGPEYAQKTAPILTLLCLSVLFYTLALSCLQMLYGTNQHRKSVPILLGEGAANLILSVVLGRRMGAVGVAWGTFIPALVAEALLVPIVTCRLFAVPLRDYYRESLLRPLAAATPLVAWLIWIRAENRVQGWISLALWLAPGLAAYLALAVRIGLGADERRMGLAWIRGRLRIPEPAGLRSVGGETEA